MSKERELLDKLLDAYDYRFLRLNGGPEYQCVIEEIRAYIAEQKQYDALADRYVEGVTGGLEKCREYMEAQVWVAKELLKTPEPTLLTKEELGTIMLAWMNTPKSRDSDLYRAVQEEVLKKNGCPVPRPEFVRLSGEEIEDCSIRTVSVTAFANAIQDLLEEKNK